MKMRDTYGSMAKYTDKIDVYINSLNDISNYENEKWSDQIRGNVYIGIFGEIFDIMLFKYGRGDSFEDLQKFFLVAEPKYKKAVEFLKTRSLPDGRMLSTFTTINAGVYTPSSIDTCFILYALIILKYI